jgi:hypothetical protein
MAEEKDIKYLNKDFSTFKSDLIEYAKSYYPTVYNDFSQASPGSMFIEMAAYVGDVLSFYLDNQLQETFLQYAKQPNNLYTMAYMLGYRPKVTSAAIVDLDVYQTVPATIDPISFEYIPDFQYALIVEPGMQIKSNVNNSSFFYIPNKIDFTTSSSYDPTTINILTTAGGNPNSYLFTKKARAISGEVKTATFSFGAAQRFPSITIQDSNIINILDVTDSDGNKWYEVPYLAQDTIIDAIQNTDPNTNNQVPYLLDRIKVPRRFTSRFLSNESLVLEFGPGINTVANQFIPDESILPNPSSISMGMTVGGDSFTASFDPTNFVTTQTYGLAPRNTTLTIQYLAGGGASANALSNELTIPVSFKATGLFDTFKTTIATNNPGPANGGGDGDTIEELRLNTLAQFPSQLRAVTQEDYMARALSMPSRFGKISKIFITKDDSTFINYIGKDLTQRDQVLVSLYVLGLDVNGKLSKPTQPLLENLQSYLSDYRLLTDAVDIKSAYIVNIGCNFQIVIRPNYSGQDVLARCILVLKEYFDIKNWQINEPIILSNIYSLLDQVAGVQTVKKVEIVNNVGESSGYSKYSYDIPGATINGVIYPSLDPCIFELKNPDIDIQGRIVTF